MSPNFLFNINIANQKYPNKIDIYEGAIKEMLKIKNNVNKFKKQTINNENSKELNFFEDKKKLIDLENSYKNYVFLLDVMQKKIEKNLLEKYNIENNTKKINNELTQYTLIKKNS